jgi:hypothetical protein
VTADKYWGEYVEFGDEAFSNTVASLLRTTALFDDVEEMEEQLVDAAKQQALALRSIALALQAVVLRLDRLEDSRS